MDSCSGLRVVMRFLAMLDGLILAIFSSMYYTNETSSRFGSNVDTFLIVFTASVGKTRHVEIFLFRNC